MCVSMCAYVCVYVCICVYVHKLMHVCVYVKKLEREEMEERVGDIEWVTIREEMVSSISASCNA